MVSTSYKTEIAIVYSSMTGNTKEVAEILYGCMREKGCEATLMEAPAIADAELCRYGVVIIGTYTWGSGEIPKEMQPLYEALESRGDKTLVTAVFGTGDSFFPDYCGAVDRFRDMLYVKTHLTATLKIELMPQEQDLPRCEKFVEAVFRNIE